VSALRIALLDHTANGYSRELEGALRRGGHEPRLLGDLTLPPVEGLLRRRGFTPALSHIPRALAELLRVEFDVVHAFTAADSAAALAWRRMRRGPAVFTCAEVLDRDTLASGRLRLATLGRAIEDTNALIASDEHVARAIERWFARSPDAVLAAQDAAAHERLYRELLA
jgi:hypothetical protein